MHLFTISDQTAQPLCSGKTVAIGAYLVFLIHGTRFFMHFFSSGRIFLNGDRMPQKFLKFHHNWSIEFAENGLSYTYKSFPTLAE